MTRWLLPLLGLAAVLGVVYAERRGQPRYLETHAFNGPVASDAVAAAVLRKLDREIRKTRMT